MSYFIQHADEKIEKHQNDLSFLLNWMNHSMITGNSFKLQQLMALENAHFYDTSSNKTDSEMYSNFIIDTVDVAKYFSVLKEYSALFQNGMINKSNYYSLSSRLSQIESGQSSANHELAYKAHVDISMKGTKWKPWKRCAQNTQLILIILTLILTIVGTNEKSNNTE